MDTQRSISVSAVIIQIFILCIVQKVQSSSCPAPCSCVFDNNKWENNTSTCDYGDAAVNITWYKMLGRPVMMMACQGTNFTCEDLPEFDIYHHQAWVIVKSCAPSSLKCMNHVYYQQPTAIESVEVHNLTAPDAASDWEKLDNVWDLRLHLKDSDPIPVYVFNSMSSLIQVYIEGGDYNQITNIEVKGTATTLMLNKMGTRKLPNVAFQLIKTYIKTLHISGTEFDVINVETFKEMAYLENLELRNNVIKSIEVTPKAATSNVLLKIFKMEYNSLPFLPNNVFNGYYSLEKIIIENNQGELKLDSHALSRLSPSVKQVQLNKCNVRQLPENVFLGTSNVHQMHINDNLIEELHPDTFSTAKSVRRLSLSGNKIKILPDVVFSNMKKLEFLDLSGNNIEKLTRDTFIYNTQLKTLLLDENNITDLEKDVLRGKSFLSVSLASNKLTNVEGLEFTDTTAWDTRELNLSHNKIETFQDWFVKIPNLEYLDLSTNKIKKLLNHHINGHKSSKLTINLRNNNISRIVGEINSFPGGEDKITLYLSDNPFECDCLSTRIIHDWKSRNIIADFEDLTCTNGLNISSIDVYLHCNKRHAKIALIGTSVVGTFFGIIVLVSIFTRRNDIWKFISKNFFRRADSESLEMAQESLKEYDLFISFAHQDEEFVTDNLLPKLEFEYGQKVCVHYRDWIVGQLIPDQIIQSVENARMTIIVLTENFLMSDWSYLEFRTAHSLGQQEGKPRVILILLNESITKDERLSIDIKSYIAINSYLVWKDPYFWTKLEKRLLRSGLRLNKYEKQSSRKDRE